MKLLIWRRLFQRVYAGKAYGIDGKEIALSEFSTKYIPVTYINDSYQTLEEAVKDLAGVKKAFPENKLNGADVKILLIYNADASYWNRVFAMMKSQEDFLSWELMWKAYNYDNDSALDKDVTDYLTSINSKVPEKGEIEYTKNKVYDLRVQFYYNSLDYANIVDYDKATVKGIQAVYGRYDKNKILRRFAITNRSGGQVFKDAGVKNSCGGVLHTGYVMNAAIPGAGNKPIPEIFLGVKQDPYYRYFDLNMSRLDNINSSKVDINLSSGEGLGSFKNLYLTDKYTAKAGDNFLEYFKNDNQTAVSKHLTGANENTLFYNINQVLKTRINSCYPEKGFYVRLSPSDGEIANNILLYSLDDDFPDVLSADALNYQPQYDEFSDLGMDIMPMAEVLAENVMLVSEDDLVNFKTSKNVPSNPSSDDYTLEKYNHGNTPNIFTRVNLLYKNLIVLKSNLTTDAIKGIFTGNNIRDIYAKNFTDNVSLALVGEESYDEYKRNVQGYLTTTIFPYIDGIRTRSFQITTGRHNSRQIYDVGANYEYKSSFIKALTVGDDKYYGFYVVTNVMPTNASELANPPTALKHFIVIVRKDKNGASARVKFSLDISPKDETKAEIGGYLLDDSVFELFGVEPSTEGGK